MKRTAFYFWRVPSETPPGKTITTRHRMTDEDAAERYGGKAVRIDNSIEWRDLPETDEERQAGSGMQPRWRD